MIFGIKVVVLNLMKLMVLWLKILKRTSLNYQDQLVSVSDGEEFEDQRALKESKLIYVLWAALQEETKKRKRIRRKD